MDRVVISEMEFTQRYDRVRRVCTTYVLTSFMYFAVCYFINRSIPGFASRSAVDPEVMRVIRVMVLIIGPASLLMANLLRKRLTALDRLAARAKGELKEFFRDYTAAQAMVMLMAEIPAFMGIVIFLCGGELIEVALLAGLSVAGKIILFPHRSEFEQSLLKLVELWEQELKARTSQPAL